eukprot:TRINITY_DN23201_c0_g1_i1.p1 TRINITY_DN23201_c0_g1~~TRINITY_DN23201_c0_g1_i1.p1  ORF type:complete len:585 (-),score=197.73 TRINITY_DN23201_c0_g1_i1:57-1778(-)
MRLTLLLLAALVCSLTAPAAAVDVTLSGIATLSADGSAVQGEVIARLPASSFSVRNATDSVGRYSLRLPPGSYDIDVSFSTAGFFCSNVQVIAEFPVSEDRYTDLRVETATVSGYVRDSSNNKPVANATITGRGLSASSTGGFDTLSLVTDDAGRYHAVVISHAYDVLVGGPSDSAESYAPTTSVLEVEAPSTQQDLPLSRAVGLTPTLIIDETPSPSDGDLVLSGDIVAFDGLNEVARVPLSGTGDTYPFQITVPEGRRFEMFFVGSLSNDRFSFASSGGVRAGILNADPSSPSKQLRLEARLAAVAVANTDMEMVPLVDISATAASLGPIGGFDTFTSSSTKSFVNILASFENANYTVILTPPESLADKYAVSVIVGQLLQSTTYYEIEDAQTLRGVVRYEDGSAAEGEVRFVVEGVTASRCTLGDAGTFEVVLGTNSLYDVELSFEFRSPSFTFLSDGAWLGDGHSWDWGEFHAFVVDTVVVSGLVDGHVDGKVQPVSDATVTMTAFSQRGGFDRFAATTDAAGLFYGRVLPAFYFDVVVSPPASSPFAATPFDDVALFAEVNKIKLELS